ncbi:MAG: aspartate 1-decarboxylase [Chitinispirillaceae bacterium]|nr:aspartate 1-decarboxylase [Chitinispirillaceae bacterium]
MKRIMLKSKIHRATITGVDINYEGSITIDERLMELADILPNEQVHALNCSNGSRCITYVIPAPRDLGTVLLNGPAARLGMPGDPVVIISYSEMDDREVAEFVPRIVVVNGRNRPSGEPEKRGGPFSQIAGLPCEKHYNERPKPSIETYGM